MLRHPRDASMSWLLLPCLLATAGLAAGEAAVRLPLQEGTDLRVIRVPLSSGSSHGRVGYVIQDDRGFIWIGTQSGLQRYDGYGYVEYRRDPAKPDSLSGSNITAMYKDRAGRLWVGADNNLDIYDPLKDGFRHFKPVGDPFEGWATRINEDLSGAIWLSTNHGLNRVDPKTWQTVRFRHKENDPTSLDSDMVRCAYEQRDGTFWVATATSLHLFDRRSGKVREKIELPFSMPALRLHSNVLLLEDHAGELWVAMSFGTGLARVDRRGKRLIEYALGPGPLKDTPLPGIRTIAEDADGALWLGSAGDGLFVLNKERTRLMRYRHNALDPKSLSADQISYVMEDREGQIWIGTTGGGLNRFLRNPLPFVRYRHEAQNPNSLMSDYTSAIIEDSSGYVWIGSTKVLTRLDRRTGKFKFYSAKSAKVDSVWAVTIAEDRKGKLWFGTIDGGLNRYDPDTDAFQVFRHDPNNAESIPHDTVLGLMTARDGTLWVGTDDGVCALNVDTGKCRLYRAADDGRVRYRAVAEGRDGSIWLGTLETGLRQLNPRTGVFKNYRQGDRPGTLSHDQVNALTVDRQGMVWVATQIGLNRLDPTSGVIQNYYEQDGLPDGAINSVSEALDGDLWIGTGNGLARLTPKTGRIRSYYESDGLLSNEFYNYASAWRGKSGEMFINSYAGVITFFPEKIVDGARNTGVTLTEFNLFGKETSIGPSSPLSESITSSQSITLSPRQNIFSIQFSALSFIDPDRIRYRYRLEGLEDEWNETDSAHRVASYTTLRAREYVLRVQAKLNRENWGEPEATLRIVVLPNWWNTWWFRTICAVAAGLMMMAWYRVRVQRLTSELNMRFEERLSERTRIAQDLHDTLLQGFLGISMQLQVLSDQVPEELPARATLDRVLMRTRQVLAEGRRALAGIRLQAGVGDDLAQSFAQLGGEFHREKDVDYRIVLEGTRRDLHPVIRDEAYRIGRESIVNAFRHSGAKHIEVRLEYTSNYFKLNVGDDGCGIDPHIVATGRSGHWGLQGIRERAEHIGAKVRILSRLHAGTEVELIVPAQVAFQLVSNTSRPKGGEAFAGTETNKD